MQPFDHEKLDVSRIAIEFVVLSMRVSMVRAVEPSGTGRGTGTQPMDCEE